MKTIRQLTNELRDLGVQGGGVLLVHTSFRAVRPVEDGPAGLIAALLEAVGPDGTLVMPSWTGDGDTPFDPAATPADGDLGVTADTFWRMPDVMRSEHPFAFAATGPLARRVIGDPLTLPPHGPDSPAGRVHELNGQVLLLGVNHDANTTIHLAELLAGAPYRVPKHITVLRDDAPARIDYGENDHCCARFALVDRWLDERGMQEHGTVGSARARLVRSRDVVSTVVRVLRREPLVFLHEDGEHCPECDDARASIPHPY